MRIGKLSFICIITFLILLSGCNSNTLIQDATGATSSQNKAIEEWIESVGIVCKSVDASSNPLVESMDEGWEAYDLISEEHTTYLLILRKEDNDFTALIDNNGKLVAGIIDNTVLPSYYE